MNKTESTVKKTASITKKLNLRSDRVRVLASIDLALVQGGTSACGTCAPPGCDDSNACC